MRKGRTKRERNDARATRSMMAGEMERERRHEKMEGVRPCKVVVFWTVHTLAKNGKARQRKGKPKIVEV